MRALTDAAGAVVQTYQTDEFGVPTATTGSSGQPFGYTGEQRDGETGLVYLRARFYDPTMGRFVQRDPAAGTLEKPESLSRYVYANNNPIKYTDPSGYYTLELYYRHLRSIWIPVIFRGAVVLVEVRITHAYLVVTDSDAEGTRYYYEAGPNGPGPSNPAEGLIDPSQYGNLQGRHGRFRRGQEPWGGSEKPFGLIAKSRVVSNDLPVDPVIEALNFFEILVNQASISYDLLTNNSNAYVHQAVEFLGFGRPTPPVFAPGWNTRLNI